MFKRLDTILFIALASGFYVLTVLQMNSTYFVYGLGTDILPLLFLMVIVYSAIRIIRDKSEASLFKKLQPLLFGLLLILTFPLAFYLADTYGGKNIILTASAAGDMEFVQLDLRDDNTFRLIESGPFGGNPFRRGHYTLCNDTLHLESRDLNLAFVLINNGANKYFDPIKLNDTIEPFFYQLHIYAAQ